MKFIPITSSEDLEKILSTEDTSFLIYKHSYRCSLAHVTMARLESWEMDRLPVYLIDVVKNRDLSQAIASKYNIRHESPQVLLITEGKCQYSASHLSIFPKTIESEFLSGALVK